MSGLLATAGAIARRNLRTAFTNPALLLPAILFPLVFLLAFAGGLSSIGNAPGFDFKSGYTSFQFVFVYLQSAAFGGIFTGIGVAADFESGFARRLFLAAPSRAGIMVGYVLAGIGRFAFTTVLLTVIGLIAGMQVDGTSVQYLGLVGLGFLLNIAATLFSVGFSMRTKSIQAAPAMQVPVFIGLFLAPVYVPIQLLDGWVHTVATVNPLTALLEAGRGFISGVPHNSTLAYALGVGFALLMLLWAALGLRRAERGV